MRNRSASVNPTMPRQEAARLNTQESSMVARLARVRKKPNERSRCADISIENVGP